MRNKPPISSQVEISWPDAPAPNLDVPLVVVHVGNLESSALDNAHVESASIDLYRHICEFEFFWSHMPAFRMT